MTKKKVRKTTSVSKVKSSKKKKSTEQITASVKNLLTKKTKKKTSTSKVELKTKKTKVKKPSRALIEFSELSLIEEQAHILLASYYGLNKTGLIKKKLAENIIHISKFYIPIQVQTLNNGSKLLFSKTQVSDSEFSIPFAINQNLTGYTSGKFNNKPNELLKDLEYVNSLIPETEDVVLNTILQSSELELFMEYIDSFDFTNAEIKDHNIFPLVKGGDIESIGNLFAKTDSNIQVMEDQFSEIIKHARTNNNSVQQKIIEEIKKNESSIAEIISEYEKSLDELIAIENAELDSLTKHFETDKENLIKQKEIDLKDVSSNISKIKSKFTRRTKKLDTEFLETLELLEQEQREIGLKVTLDEEELKKTQLKELKSLKRSIKKRLKVYKAEYDANITTHKAESQEIEEKLRSQLNAIDTDYMYYGQEKLIKLASLMNSWEQSIEGLVINFRSNRREVDTARGISNISHAASRLINETKDNFLQLESNRNVMIHFIDDEITPLRDRQSGEREGEERGIRIELEENRLLIEGILDQFHDGFQEFSFQLDQELPQLISAHQPLTAGLNQENQKIVEKSLKIISDQKATQVKISNEIHQERETELADYLTAENSILIKFDQTQEKLNLEFKQNTAVLQDKIDKLTGENITKIIQCEKASKADRDKLDTLSNNLNNLMANIEEKIDSAKTIINGQWIKFSSLAVNHKKLNGQESTLLFPSWIAQVENKKTQEKRYMIYLPSKFPDTRSDQKQNINDLRIDLYPKWNNYLHELVSKYLHANGTELWVNLEEPILKNADTLSAIKESLHKLSLFSTKEIEEMIANVS